MENEPAGCVQAYPPFSAGKHIGKLGGDRQTGVRLVAVPTPGSTSRAANLIDAAGLPMRLCLMFSAP
jgi:hypothetical protein